MADLDTELQTRGPLGHPITTTLRAIIQGASDILTALGAATSAQGAKADSALQPVVAGAGIGGGGFAKHLLVAGGAAGDIAVSGIKTGDELNEVIQYIGAGTAVTNVVDLTSEFTITGANKINNTSGTATTGSKLLVRWTKKTA